MPEAATTEFWKELKPIENVFKPDGLPEIFCKDAPTDDLRYYVPLTETVFTRPLFISPSQNRWCDILMATGPGLVNRHYHPHQVFGFTLSGKWGYLEHDWTATAGDFLYEAPGEAHTLVAYEHEDPMKIFFNVTGPLIWLDEVVVRVEGAGVCATDLHAIDGLMEPAGVTLPRVLGHENAGRVAAVGDLVSTVAVGDP